MNNKKSIGNHRLLLQAVLELAAREWCSVPPCPRGGPPPPGVGPSPLGGGGLDKRGGGVFGNSILQRLSAGSGEPCPFLHMAVRPARFPHGQVRLLRLHCLARCPALCPSHDGSRGRVSSTERDKIFHMRTQPTEIPFPCAGQGPSGRGRGQLHSRGIGGEGMAPAGYTGPAAASWALL